VRKSRDAPIKLPAGKKARTVTALDEVERALSVLDGRHPDYMRAQRETREAAAARVRELSVERSRAWRTKTARALLSLAQIVLVCASLWGGYRVFLLARTLSSGLDAAASRVGTSGFFVAGSSQLWHPHELKIDAAGPMCFVAVTSAARGEMLVTHGASSIHNGHSVGWCSCGPETIELKAPSSASAIEGLRLYGVDARVLGGPQGWPFSSARPALIAPGGEECQESALIGWIADRRFPQEAVDASWFESGPGKILSVAGFRPVAGSSAGRFFAVVEAAPGSCMVALRPQATPLPDALTLEDMDGKALAGGNALLWCDTSAGKAVTVRSRGDTSTLVVAAPAARVGGALGTREWVERAGVGAITTWMREDELSLDATALLRASAVPDVASGAPSAQARFVSVSLHTAKSLVRSLSPDGSLYACSPSLDSGALESVCALVGTQSWLAAPGEKTGLAAAPTPFWLAALEDRADEGAMRAKVELLALARRLTSERFEVSMFEGVTESAPGRISVLGRARSDAIVALEVEDAAPWVLPYTDGPPWTLADPRIVALPPEGRVSLTAMPRPTADSKHRRTIVFRRAHAP
jgi:hypothetical protein